MKYPEDINKLPKNYPIYFLKLDGIHLLDGFKYGYATTDDGLKKLLIQYLAEKNGEYRNIYVSIETKRISFEVKRYDDWYNVTIGIIEFNKVY